MNITLSVDDEITRAALRRADALGTSVNQPVRDHLKELAGNVDSEADCHGIRTSLKGFPRQFARLEI